VNIYSPGLAFIFQTVIWWVKLFDGFKSQINVPSSGVPQGAISSTLLISLSLNNPPSIIHKIKLLESAEDVKLFMNIQSILDFVTLQAELKIPSNYFQMYYKLY